jgi:hypothetical protein
MTTEVSTARKAGVARAFGAGGVAAIVAVSLWGALWPATVLTGMPGGGDGSILAASRTAAFAMGAGARLLALVVLLAVSLAWNAAESRRSPDLGVAEILWDPQVGRQAAGFLVLFLFFGLTFGGQIAWTSDDLSRIVVVPAAAAADVARAFALLGGVVLGVEVLTRLARFAGARLEIALSGR